ncbi:hypothetical protein ACPPVO_41570 [Dactylosporangium sp. McL0621]|uniref:hypothetical protein n=1 Tax=Dactylosporangium sp. McL0621 TaxID=3415678 RepID=UPI003CEAB52C
MSYPVGRSIVEASLRAAGVLLLALDFSRGEGDQAVTVLLRAARYSELGSTYHLPRGIPSRPRRVLTLYAVPSEVRTEARAALTTGGGLHRACALLAGAEHANPTWLDKSHHWTAYLRDGVLGQEETEG